MEKVYICSAVRTPIGSFGGCLSSLSAVDLGVIASKEALTRADISPDEINEVFIGNVCTANEGQSPARQVAIKSGLSYHTPATTINKVCASGMKAIMLGAQSIQLGINDVVMVGGMESMSNVPYYLPHYRWGKKYGSGEIIDGLLKDGLSDAYQQIAMGVFADKTADKYQISREQQDEFAIASYEKVKESYQRNEWKDEIAAVEVKSKKGILTITEDEEYKKVIFEKIPQLRPAFSEKGSVTAANASTINDGASMLVLASQSYAREKDLPILAEVVAYADAAQEPESFTTTPIQSTKKILEQSKLTLNDIDYFEVNEAFAVVPLIYQKELEIAQEKINVFGGAVALGHPIGASGARIITTLLNVLSKRNATTGLASICNGGGGASSMIIRSFPS